MNNEVMFSSKSDEWSTPQNIFDDLNQEFDFNLDPCSTEENHKCSFYFTKETDGLSQNWGGVARVLQSALFTNWEMGRKGFPRRSQRRNDCRLADSSANRHEILSRFHSSPIGNPIYQRKIEIRKS